MIRRREFIALLGGAAAAWPLVARAQQGGQARRVGVLMGAAADDPDAQANIAALHQGLQEAGWVIGSNLRVDVRWSAGDSARLRELAAELVALGPDAIVAGIGPTTPALLQATRTIPLVFLHVVDPVGAGFVKSLARPGGNISGFMLFEYGLAGKWLDLLKEVAPQLARVAVIREQLGAAVGTVGIGQWAVIQAFASPMGVELTPINLPGGEWEQEVAAFARGPTDGLIVVVSVVAAVQRQRIIQLAAQHRLPAVYFNRSFVEAGGLISYGPRAVDNYRRAAGYVDRILKGTKPADLPVQAPTKYELAINLKTAKALGIEVPHTLLARADEVIE
jgi:putative tryptophan/tyrosine transport system substrate-binding protein